jgi:chorismate dehydratase
MRVTAVSYLNTKPLLYGLLSSDLHDELDIQLDIPSVCAQRMIAGEADLGLIPVAALPEIPDWQLISDYCIGTDGAVRTVCIYSQRPIEELETIYLDFHSRTSVMLTRLLLREYWHLSPRLVHAQPGYENKIADQTGGLVIGDRAIEWEPRFQYRYDLGEEWKKHTGLPFVFAAWVSRQPLPAAFVQRFNDALSAGLQALPELLLLLPNPRPGFDLEQYYRRHISYDLTGEKRKAMERFLDFVRQETSIPA